MSVMPGYAPSYSTVWWSSGLKRGSPESELDVRILRQSSATPLASSSGSPDPQKPRRLGHAAILLTALTPAAASQLAIKVARLAAWPGRRVRHDGRLRRDWIELGEDGLQPTDARRQREAVGGNPFAYQLGE